jgi:hypothetical protein
VTVDRADAADEPIGRSAFDELLQRAPPALAGDDERCVFDETAVVDEVGDVLAVLAQSPRATASGRR